MILQLSVRKPVDSGRLLLGFSPTGRIVFGCIGVFLLGGLLLAGELALVSLLVGLISLVAAIYNETWLFDRPGKLVINQKHFIFTFGCRSYQLDQVGAVILRVVSGPGPIDKEDFMKKEQTAIPKALRKGRAVLLLELNGTDQPRRLILDDRSHRDADKLEALGNSIAVYCGIPFIKGRHQYT